MDEKLVYAHISTSLHRGRLNPCLLIKQSALLSSSLVSLKTRHYSARPVVNPALFTITVIVNGDTLIPASLARSLH